METKKLLAIALLLLNAPLFGASASGGGGGTTPPTPAAAVETKVQREEREARAEKAAADQRAANAERMRKLAEAQNSASAVAPSPAATGADLNPPKPTMIVTKDKTLYLGPDGTVTHVSYPDFECLSFHYFFHCTLDNTANAHPTLTNSCSWSHKSKFPHTTVASLIAYVHELNESAVADYNKAFYAQRTTYSRPRIQVYQASPFRGPLKPGEDFDPEKGIIITPPEGLDQCKTVWTKSYGEPQG